MTSPLKPKYCLPVKLHIITSFTKYYMVYINCEWILESPARGCKMYWYFAVYFDDSI